MKMKFHLPGAAKLRIAIVVLLFAAPVFFLLGVGVYHLWDAGYAFAAWWPMALCFLAAYGLAWHWTRRRKSLMMPKGKVEVPNHWTERDKEAWAVVQAYSESIPPLAEKDLSDMTRYAADAKVLVEKVTAIYQPDAKDPFGHLTLPEILACAELVAADLAQLVEKYVPGSHAISVNNFKHVKRAVDWYERGRNLYWVFSAILDPVRAGAQILATKAGLQTTLKQVQNNVLTWFYTTYLLELGRYLIELNSGRLRVGVKRYRELLEKKEAMPADVGTPDVTVVPDPTATGDRLQTDPNRITIGIVGPVKAGKSSLVNAIFGEQKADVASVPLTLSATRYDLHPAGFTPLSLIDTAGFGYQGAGDADVAAAAEVFAKSDLVMLVVPARSAARKPEVEFLERVRALFAKKPELRLPPVVLVLSHIDALSPAMEWNPPYDWKMGRRSKEESIREAVTAAREQFAKGVIDAVPVCTALDRGYGVQDELLPTLANQLDDARGVQFLRVLHAEDAADKTRKVIGQALNAGKEALKLIWQNANKLPKG